tara:strand:- start:5 stop:442 length:438 start_codon:yes stop_codon:yes gene_type:complete
MRVEMKLETWPGKDGWMKKKPLGMGDLLGRTSERYYSKERLEKMMKDKMSPHFESSYAKGLPIDCLHDFKIHFKGKYRIRYRGKSDYSKRYFREPNHCLQKYATSFAVYPLYETEDDFKNDIEDVHIQENEQLDNLMRTWEKEYA